MKLTRLMIDVTPLRISREFRIVFVARIVSIFGLGFAAVALPTQVYQLTGSSFLVATVHTANAVSVLGGTLVGGVLADRGDRRRLIVVGRASAVVGYTVLAANSFLFDQPLLWVIHASALFIGFFGSFSAVALQAAAPGFVPRDKLPAAGALLALNGELGAVLAPALGGALIAAAGIGGNYALTAALSLVTTVLVWRLPRLEPDGDRQRESVLQSVRTGTRFALHHRVVGPLLLLGFAQLLFASPQVLINEFTDTVLGGGPATVGLLYTAPALGALLGSLTSGWTGHLRRTGTVLIGAVGLCGLAVLGLGLSPALPIAFAFLVLLGYAQVSEEILRYALVQSHTPADLRGRVNSLWTAQATVGDSAGALALGALAPLLGVAATIAAGGVLTVLSVAALALVFPRLRTAQVLVVSDDSGDSANEPVAATNRQERPRGLLPHQPSRGVP